MADRLSFTTDQVDTLLKKVDPQEERLNTLTQEVAINTSDIEGIKEDQSKEQHYRGDYKTNAEIQALTGNSNGDFAYSVESGTRWVFNTTWSDSGEEWVDTPTPAGDSTPLVDGAGSPGSSNAFSRQDHRHPTDTTRAAASDVYKKSETYSRSELYTRSEVNVINGKMIQENVSTGATYISLTHNRVYMWGPATSRSVNVSDENFPSGGSAVIQVTGGVKPVFQGTGLNFLFAKGVSSLDDNIIVYSVLRNANNVYINAAIYNSTGS